MKIQQPRTAAGSFDTNGGSPHEKHRFHIQAAHLSRVNAKIARHNGETSQAETLEASASDHERIAAGHLAAALKT